MSAQAASNSFPSAGELREDRDRIIEVEGRTKALEDRQDRTDDAITRIDARMYKALILLITLLLTSLGSVLLEMWQHSLPKAG